jgi:deoxyribonuclease V
VPLKLHHAHPWNVLPSEAIEIQQRLRDRVVVEDRIGRVRFVAGVDVGFESGNTVTRAAVAVLELPGLELRDHGIARLPTSFPYVPGLLSFREIPAVLDALAALHHMPDLILCDGQGLAHPRRFGIACHLGVLTDIPTIGVAKTRLIGEHVPVSEHKGEWRPLTHGGETIGAVVRTRTNVKPVFVSVGHRISLATAIEYLMRCISRYRLPETTRWAHRLASGTEEQIARALG